LQVNFIAQWTGLVSVGHKSSHRLSGGELRAIKADAGGDRLMAWGPVLSRRSSPMPTAPSLNPANRIRRRLSRPQRLDIQHRLDDAPIEGSSILHRLATMQVGGDLIAPSLERHERCAPHALRERLSITHGSTFPCEI
jgi:hypothetical protein